MTDVSMVCGTTHCALNGDRTHRDRPLWLKPHQQKSHSHSLKKLYICFWLWGINVCRLLTLNITLNFLVITNLKKAYVQDLTTVSAIKYTRSPTTYWVQECLTLCAAMAGHAIITVPWGSSIGRYPKYLLHVWNFFRRMSYVVQFSSDVHRASYLVHYVESS